MTRKQNSAKKLDWKEMMAEQPEFLRPLVQEVLQQILEAEMDETVGAGKSERTARRARVNGRRGGWGIGLGTTVER